MVAGTKATLSILILFFMGLMDFLVVASAESSIELVRRAYAKPTVENLKPFISYLEEQKKLLSEDYFVMEGDLRFPTSKQVKGFFWVPDISTKSGKQKEKAYEGNGELMVRVTPEGQLDYWKEEESRHLTYAIDKRTFSEKEYNIIVANMLEAASDWNKACPPCKVHFEHQVKHDESPSHDEVKFIVKKIKKFFPIATAFSKSSAQDDYFLRIAQTFFLRSYGEMRAGILRHELGHILGYAHEHMRKGGVPGCTPDRNDGSTLLPLTKYNPNSVMHYFCGSRDLKERKMILTESDKEGHENLYLHGLDFEKNYKMQARNSGEFLMKTKLKRPFPIQINGDLAKLKGRGSGKLISSQQKDGIEDVYSLIFYFDGWNYPRASAEVFVSLNSIPNLVPRKKYQTKDGDSLCGIIQSQTSFPGKCSKILVDEISRMNNWDASQRFLLPNKEIVLPDLKFIKHTVTKYLNLYEKTERVRLEDYKKRFKPKPSFTYVDPQKKLVEVQHEEWILIVPKLKKFQIDKAIEEVKAKDLEHTYLHVKEGRIKIEEKVQFSTKLEPENIALKCTKNLEEDYYFLGKSRVKIKKESRPPCKSKRLMGEGPEIIILDKRFFPHRDLINVIDWQIWKDQLLSENREKDALNLTQKLSDLEEDQKNTPEKSCGNTVSWKNQYHGTHLSCIIGCEKNDWNYLGICPGVSIRPIIWDKNTDNVDLLKKVKFDFRYERNSFKIMLIATEIPYDDHLLHPKDKKKLRELDYRLNKHHVLKAIRDKNILLIAAVGQPENLADPNDPPLSFDKDSAKAPSNLGDQPFVLNVTVCDPCEPSNSRLWEKSHYSDDPDLVHVAAPGLKIPGLANDSDYTEGSGTSQAAAFVAGLAADMASTFPDDYWIPKMVKRRIQVTSNPIMNLILDGELGSGNLERKISSGIVDPNLALLYPGVGWLKKIEGEGNKNPDYEPIEILGWCTKNFHLAPGEKRDAPSSWRTEIGRQTSTPAIFRILSVSEIENNERKWINYRDLYRDGEEVGGVIEIIGPGIWPNGWTEKKYLLRYIPIKDRISFTERGDPNDLTLSEIDDLIFPNDKEIRNYVEDCGGLA